MSVKHSRAMFQEKSNQRTRSASQRRRSTSRDARVRSSQRSGRSGGSSSRGLGNNMERQNSARRSFSTGQSTMKGMVNGRHSGQSNKGGRVKSPKEYEDTPVTSHRKGFSLKLSRSSGGDNHRTFSGNKGISKYHSVPNVQSRRRGRSATPKRQNTASKDVVHEGRGFAGRLRSLSKKVMGGKKTQNARQRSSSRGERAPSLQHHEIQGNAPFGLVGETAKRKRGKSLPSRFALRKSPRANDADSAILRENLGLMSDASALNWGGSVWTEDMTKGEEETIDYNDTRPKQKNNQQPRGRSASAGRRSFSSGDRRPRVNSSGSRSSEGRRGSNERHRSSKLNNEQRQVRKSRSRSRGMVGQGMASRGHKSEKKSRDQQAALNEHCLKHFGVRNEGRRHDKQRSHRRSHYDHRNEREDQFEQEERERKSRSKSMPHIGGIRNLYVDKEDLVRHPISPVASVDSSWRYKRIRQKLKMKARRKSQDDEGEEKKVRSKSCEPDLERRCSDKSGEEGDIGDGVNMGAAMVPFVHERAVVPSDREAIVNYNLAYNLGEITGDFIFNQEGGDTKEGEEEEASLLVTTCSSDEEEEMTHEPAAVLSTRPEPIETSPSGKSNSPERNIERKPSIGHESAAKSGKFTVGTYGSGTWHGRAPDPVASLHGDTTVLSPGGTYDNTLLSPRTPMDPPTASGSTYKTDPPVTRRATSPDSFIEASGGKSEASSDNGSGDVGQEKGEMRSEGEGDSTSHDDVVDRSTDSNVRDDNSEDGSLFDDAPSTTGTMEGKMYAKYSTPPLHSAIRLRKPTGSVASSHKPRRKKKKDRGRPSKHSICGESTADGDGDNSKVGAKSKDVDFEARPASKGNDYQDGEDEECYPQHRSRNKAIKANISEIEVDEGNDMVSAITMPPALLKAPPSHSRIRAKKPRNRNGQLSSHRENKDEDDVDAVGTITGHEIDVHSNSTRDPVSEITMPVALHPPFAKVLQSFRQQTPLPEEDSARPYQHPVPEENRVRPHPHVGLSSLASPQKASPGPRKAVPPPPPRPMPPPPLRPQRSVGSGMANIPPPSVAAAHEKHGGQQPIAASVVLEDAAAQLMSVQSGLNRAPDEGSQGRPQPPPRRRSLSDSSDLPLPAIHHIQRVNNMPYTDEYHDMGLYSGETNEYGIPHGKGRMKYDDDGECLEGNWINGTWCGPDAAHRLSSGLSSFKGNMPAPQARKNSATSR